MQDSPSSSSNSSNNAIVVVDAADSKNVLIQCVAPKTGSDVLSALQIKLGVGLLYRSDGYTMLGSDVLQAGEYKYDWQQAPAAAVPGLLSLAQLLDAPVPTLPAVAAASHTSESRAFCFYPDRVEQDAAYFVTALRSFRDGPGADHIPRFRPVEFVGTNLTGSADSEAGVAICFANVTVKCEEVLRQFGHQECGYMPLARRGLLTQLARAPDAQPAEPTACNAATAAAAAAGTGAAAAAVLGVGATFLAEPAYQSRRCSSSSGDAWKGKPDLILACFPGSNVQQQQHSSSSVSNTQHLERKVMAVGELKVREMLTNGGVPLELAAMYEQGDTRAKAVLGQAFSYMVQLQVRLGFITCHDVLWLLERRDQEHKVLHISAPIMASASAPDPTIMLAMCWLQHTAITDTRPPLQLPALAGSDDNPRGGTSSRPHSGGAGNAGGSTWGCSQARDPDKRKPSQPEHFRDYVSGSEYSDEGMPSDQLQGLTDGQVLQRAAAAPAFYQLRGLPALPLVPLACMQSSGTIVGSGATSIVLQGSFQGQACAIKLLLLDDAHYWRREVVAYQHMRALQGCCLPKLLGLGLTCQGTCCFLALELVQGASLGQGMAITKPVADAAVMALQHVHDLGYLHGDVRLENLLRSYAASGTVRVVLVDFGRARPGSSKECDVEMAGLQRLLDMAH